MGNISQNTHDTINCMVLRKEMDEKHLTGNLTSIAKDLRSKFDTNQRNTRDQKDVDKHQVKEEILTIMRPHNTPKIMVRLSKRWPS